MHTPDATAWATIDTGAQLDTTLATSWQTNTTFDATAWHANPTADANAWQTNPPQETTGENWQTQEAGWTADTWTADTTGWLSDVKQEPTDWDSWQSDATQNATGWQPGTQETAGWETAVNETGWTGDATVDATGWDGDATLDNTGWHTNTAQDNGGWQADTAATCLLAGTFLFLVCDPFGATCSWPSTAGLKAMLLGSDLCLSLWFCPFMLHDLFTYHCFQPSLFKNVQECSRTYALFTFLEFSMRDSSISLLMPEFQCTIMQWVTVTCALDMISLGCHYCKFSVWSSTHGVSLTDSLATLVRTSQDWTGSASMESTALAGATSHVDSRRPPEPVNPPPRRTTCGWDHFETAKSFRSIQDSGIIIDVLIYTYRWYA